MTNTQKAAAINMAVQNGDAKTVVELVTENYIQHTPMVRDGRDGLADLVNGIKNKAIPAPKITNVRSFEDGEFVVLHHDVYWPNRKAMFEIYRFENGLAAEHWSGIVDHPETTVSGHSMVDGPSEITDRQFTKKNKEFVRDFVETVLIDQQLDKILDFYNPDVIQHNPFFDNTVPGLINGFIALQKEGITLQIEKIFKVLGEGNFVLVCSEGKFADIPTAFFDLVRIENGKIAEHWDVIQQIPDKPANDNGFFKASLYKRIGGYDGICAFVDLAFPRVAVHRLLEKYFTGHAMESKFRQRQLIVDKLSSTLQGPTIYLGRSLETVHKGLNITTSEWDIFMEIITGAMDERNIKGEDKDDFVSIFENVFRTVTVETEMND